MLGGSGLCRSGSSTFRSGGRRDADTCAAILLLLLPSQVLALHLLLELAKSKGYQVPSTPAPEAGIEGEIQKSKSKWQLYLDQLPRSYTSM